MLVPSGPRALQGPEEDAPGSRSRESRGWGGRTPPVGSGRRERPGRGRWGRWLERRGQGHTERRRRLLPLPSVGAPSRALIGAAAAAGRVSAASLRDATPSNCGRDRRYAAASCPGARPGRPGPRPAPRPARPSPPPPGRAGTLRHARPPTASAASSPAEAAEPSPRVPRPHGPSVGGPLASQPLELGLRPPVPPLLTAHLASELHARRVESSRALRSRGGARPRACGEEVVAESQGLSFTRAVGKRRVGKGGPSRLWNLQSSFVGEEGAGGRGRNGCKRGKETVKEGLGPCVVGGGGVLPRGRRPGPKTQHRAFTLWPGSSGCPGPFSDQNRCL